MSQKRYETNPFLQDMVIPLKGKAVRLSRLGKDDNVLVNHSTGEVQGTHVTTYKKVDAAQFLKLFTQNIGLTFGLKACGIKALNVLCWAVQARCLGKDEVDLDKYALAEFIECHKESDPPLVLSMATFKRGITDLEEANIIAKTMRMGRYFINPNFMFNGDRIAFTTVVEKVSDEEANQQDLKLEI